MSVPLRLFPVRQRWLVCQTTDSGKVIYAEAFFSRSRADRAAKAANERNKWYDSRQKAVVARLPLDIR